MFAIGELPRIIKMISQTSRCFKIIFTIRKFQTIIKSHVLYFTFYKTTTTFFALAHHLKLLGLWLSCGLRKPTGGATWVMA